MKFQKLLLSVATAFLLVGASGEAAAIACLGGTVAAETVDEIVIKAGESCIIVNSVVKGQIKARPGAIAVIVKNTDVGARIRIDGTSLVSIMDTTVYLGNLVVLDSGQVNIRNGFARKGDIRLEGNDNVHLTLSVAKNITCSNNENLVAFVNAAASTNDTCSNLVTP
jgi:hypothetical protein